MLLSRSLVLLSSCAYLWCIGVAHAQADRWRPDKHVEIVAGVSPGGSQDRTARLIQKIIQTQQLVNVPSSVINKPGGGGAVSLAYMNQHLGDGHYLLVSSVPLLANHITGRSSLCYWDFTPIAQLFTEYVSLTVRADSPLRSAKDVVERLRNDPASLSIAVGTTYGNQNHVAVAEVFRSIGGDVRKLKAVVFNSTGEAVAALLGGHVDAVSAPPSNIATYVEAGKLRALAISAPTRLTGIFANTPTWKEQGIEVVVASDRGVIGPKGLNKSQMSYWESVIERATASDEWKNDLAKNSWVNNFMKSAESRKYLQGAYENLRVALTQLGLAKQTTPSAAQSP